jgi:hypothetical protein
MIRITGAKTTEEAEEIGARLLEQSLLPQIIQGDVYVAAEDAERAWQILDVPETPPDLLKPAPFHPCPKCDAPDPIWYGRRKAMVWLVLLAILIAIMLLQLPGFAVASIACFVVFMIAVTKIPEWKCRQCGHQWSKELERDEPQ